jgi:hypothetical protein
MLVAVRKIPALGSEIRLEIPSGPASALAKLTKTSHQLSARVLRSTSVEGFNLVGLKFSQPLLRSSNRAPAKKRNALSVA